MHLSTYLFGKLPLVSERRKKRSATGGEYKNLNLKKNTLVYIMYIYIYSSQLDFDQNGYCTRQVICTLVHCTAQGTYYTYSNTTTHEQRYVYVQYKIRVHTRRQGPLRMTSFHFFPPHNERTCRRREHASRAWLYTQYAYIVVLLVSRIRSRHSHRQGVKIKKFQTNV